MRSPLTLTRFAAVFAAAVILGGQISTASGQGVPAKKPALDTSKKHQQADTSIHRIKVKKEIPLTGSAGGEVGAPLSGSVIQAAIDSALAFERATRSMQEDYARDAQRYLDSVGAAYAIRRAVAAARAEAAGIRAGERADSLAHAEQAEREAAAALRHHLARGFYFGLAGGASTPRSDLRDGYSGGWNTTVPIGWDASGAPLGVRADFTVDRLNGTRIQDVMQHTGAANGDITIWSLNTDLKLRMRAPGAPSRTNIYVLGGVGAHRVANAVYGVTGANAGRDLSFSDAKTNFGWNAGAGLSVAWGPSELFVESRLVHVETDLGYHTNGGIGKSTNFMPIVVGLQWF